MTLTLEIPERLARQLEALPEEERNRLAVAALSDAVESLFRREDRFDQETIDELHQAFRIGIADEVTVSLEDYARQRGVTL